ncbi:unnamed protein product, partial [marine sediment metagenome]
MAKKKANTKRKSRSQPEPKGESWWKRFFHFIVLPPVRRLILLVIIISLLFWQWSALTSWAASVRDSTLELFGWGLVFIIIAFGILVGVVWGRRVLSLIYHWNQWLGGIAFILAIWGILAFFGLGGSFGRNIIGSPDFVGALRLLGLVVIGIILVAPGVCFRLLLSFTSWVGEQLKKRPAPEEATYIEPTTAEEPISTPLTIPQEPLTRETEAESATPVLTPTPGQQELRQVAQEVWKKYGESPALVTVDGWKLPPIDILDSVPEVEFGQADNMQRAKVIEDALASYGVAAKVVQINAGPTVTQFGVEPGWDKKMKEIKERDKDGNVKVRLEEVSKT